MRQCWPNSYQPFIPWSDRGTDLNSCSRSRPVPAEVAIRQTCAKVPHMCHRQLQDTILGRIVPHSGVYRKCRIATFVAWIESCGNVIVEARFTRASSPAGGQAMLDCGSPLIGQPSQPGRLLDDLRNTRVPKQTRLESLASSFRSQDRAIFQSRLTVRLETDNAAAISSMAKPE